MKRDSEQKLSSVNFCIFWRWRLIPFIASWGLLIIKLKFIQTIFAEYLLYNDKNRESIDNNVAFILTQDMTAQHKIKKRKTQSDILIWTWSRIRTPRIGLDKFDWASLIYSTAIGTVICSNIQFIGEYFQPDLKSGTAAAARKMLNDGCKVWSRICVRELSACQDSPELENE